MEQIYKEVNKRNIQRRLEKNAKDVKFLLTVNISSTKMLRNGSCRFGECNNCNTAVKD